MEEDKVFVGKKQPTGASAYRCWETFKKGRQKARYGSGGPWDPIFDPDSAKRPSPAQGW
jgi:hypothetical protein